MPTFSKLILIGRPGSGKSEFIDCLKKTPEQAREAKFFIGPVHELDDFPWLWNKFVEDDWWEAAGQQRLCSEKREHAYVVKGREVLDFCTQKFNFEIEKVPPDKTILIEFARGKADGGYRYALNQFSDLLLQDAAILFIYTSYEESCRRNEARYQEKLKHSILAHKLPEADQIRFSRDIDWLEWTNHQPSGYLIIRNHQIPFVTMNNEPEYKQVELLTERYGSALSTLMQLCNGVAREVKCA